MFIIERERICIDLSAVEIFMLIVFDQSRHLADTVCPVEQL